MAEFVIKILCTGILWGVIEVAVIGTGHTIVWWIALLIATAVVWGWFLFIDADLID